MALVHARLRWTFLLRGLWASGLRSGEALGLTWEYSDRISVDLTDDYPLLRVPEPAEKGNEDRLLPMAPEFAELLDEVPADNRHGTVFGIEFATDWASRIVCRIGSDAGVVVSRKNGRTKYASAHDLRRSFGERWAGLVEAHALREFMRHGRIETTLRYYVGRNARRTAQTLWEVRGCIRGHSPLSAAPASPKTPLKVVVF